MAWILEDSAAVAVVVESQEMSAAVQDARAGLPGLQDVWVLDEGAVETLVEHGTTAGVNEATLEERRSAAGLDDLATIIYTSGTTGRPKGCELTHGNFVVLTENTTQRIQQVVSAGGASTLLFLPLAHVFARFIQVLCISSGAPLGHSADIKTLLPDLATFQPSSLLAVPRVFEKIHNSAEQQAEAQRRGSIFCRAADAAVQHSRSLDTGSGGLGLRVRYTLFNRLVYPKVRSALEGRAQYAVSGGGPLGRASGALLPRRRPDGPGGVRPHRDHGSRQRQPAGEDRNRQRRADAPRRLGADRGRRRDPAPGPPGPPGLPGLLEEPRGDRGGHRRRLVLHGRPRRAGRG